MMTEVSAAQAEAKDLPKDLLAAPKDLLVIPLEDIEEKPEEKPEKKPLGAELQSGAESQFTASEELRVNSDEHLQLTEASDRNDQPLEKDVICTTDAEAQVEATTDTLNVCLEETQTEDNQLLTEMVRTQQAFVTRRSSEQDIYQSNAAPYTMTFCRTGWREGRRTELMRPQQVFVTRPSSEQDTDQSNAVPYTMTFYRTGWRGRRRTEGSRVECTSPRTDSNADRGRAAGRTQQVFVERPSSVQDIDQSNAMPYTMTFYRTGWRGRRRTEGSRVECTPPRTDSIADGG
ncbi:hypothetical protein MHYP_G00201850 [Metynnis hypsauchen]